MNAIRPSPIQPPPGLEKEEPEFREEDDIPADDGRQQDEDASPPPVDSPEPLSREIERE